MTDELPLLHGAHVRTHVGLCWYAKFAVTLNINFMAGVRYFWAHDKNKSGGPAYSSLTPALTAAVWDVTQCSLVKIQRNLTKPTAYTYGLQEYAPRPCFALLVTFQKNRDVNENYVKQERYSGNEKDLKIWK
jgi:hypothetical protein